jgi:hypothetical protein
VQLADPDNTLRASLGVSGRSTFLYVNNGETSVVAGYGVADEGDLSAEIERLISS